MLKQAAFILGVTLMTATSASGDSTKETDSRENLQKATFAGGCFWCMEQPFDRLDGVISTTVGYTGGTKRNPTYQEVCSGDTGHIEAVQVTYDPSKISYLQLLDVFWKNIDPAQHNGQFVDIGSQYKTAIFYHTEDQKRWARDSKRKLEESGRFGQKIATEIRPAVEFYEAEDYHQDYYLKNPIPYKSYRRGSGRDLFLEKTWGKKGR